MQRVIQAARKESHDRWQREEQWGKDAMTALMRHYGGDSQAAHLAAIVLALLRDREERERYIDGSRCQ
jgi:hypothetical protein